MPVDPASRAWMEREQFLRRAAEMGVKPSAMAREYDAAPIDPNSNVPEHLQRVRYAREQHRDTIARGPRVKQSPVFDRQQRRGMQAMGVDPSMARMGFYGNANDYAGLKNLMQNARTPADFAKASMLAGAFTGNPEYMKQAMVGVGHGVTAHGYNMDYMGKVAAANAQKYGYDQQLKGTRIQANADRYRTDKTYDAAMRGHDVDEQGNWMQFGSSVLGTGASMLNSMWDRASKERTAAAAEAGATERTKLEQDREDKRHERTSGIQADQLEAQREENRLRRQEEQRRWTEENRRANEELALRRQTAEHEMSQNPTYSSVRENAEYNADGLDAITDFAMDAHLTSARVSDDPVSQSEYWVSTAVGSKGWNGLVSDVEQAKANGTGLSDYQWFDRVGEEVNKITRSVWKKTHGANAEPTAHDYYEVFLQRTRMEDSAYMRALWESRFGDDVGAGG